MIEKQIKQSLTSLFGKGVTILKNDNWFSYPKEKQGSIMKAGGLITYREETKKVWGKGRKIFDGANFQYYTDYKVDTILEFWGAEAEDQVLRVMEILSNNEENFADNDLGVLSYGNINNLTFLENVRYKDRFSLAIKFKFVYNKKVEQGYPIKTAEFDLTNKGI